MCTTPGRGVGFKTMLGGTLSRRRPLRFIAQLCKRTLREVDAFICLRERGTMLLDFLRERKEVFSQFSDRLPEPGNIELLVRLYKRAALEQTSSVAEHVVAKAATPEQDCSIAVSATRHGHRLAWCAT
jgi:hypothetical protein